MTQRFTRNIRKLAFGGLLLIAHFGAISWVEAQTVSFDSVGEFSGEFTKKAGANGNDFEEASSIGINGTRGIRRSVVGIDRVSYTKNTSFGGISNAASLSIRFNYSTNSTGSGGEPLMFGVTTNSNFIGAETGSAVDDFIGVEVSQRLTGSNESKLTLFNGVNGTLTDAADSGFENLTPGWYEIEVNVDQAVGGFDLSVALHRMSANGTTRSESDIITAAISNLSNNDLLLASNLYLFLGGEDTYNRGIEGIDELNYSGFSIIVGIDAPSGLVASAISHDQINLAWNDNANNESGFRIERRLGGGAWSEIATVFANSESYSDTGLSADTGYTYRIVAFNSESNSAPSNEASATTSGPPAPSAPANLVASTFSSTRIDLSWTDTSNDEDSFRIERKVENGSFAQLLDLPANTENYSDTGLSTTTTYTYRVRAGNANGFSGQSNESSATTTDAPIPAAPSNLRFTSTSVSQVSIAWNDDSDDESGFKIERKIYGSTFEEIADLAAGSTSYDDIDVSELGNYTYRVYAYNDNGPSAYSSNIVVILPFLAPSNLVAQAIASNQVNLTWTESSLVENGVRIERKEENGTYITLINLNIDAMSYSDFSVVELTNYTYRVSAFRFSTFSDFTNEASVTTPNISPPANPSNLKITGQGLDHVLLTWADRSSDELGFRIQRKTGGGGFETLADIDAESTSYTDTQVGELQGYTYRVVSYNDGGDSGPSNEVSTVIEFNDPTNLNALVISHEQIDLTWNDNSVAESGYRVERRTGLGGFEIVSDLPSGTTSYSDTDTLHLTSYTYRVLGLSGNGNSNPTNEASVTTPNLPVPGSPNNLTAILIDTNYVMLNWTDSSIDELGFRIERKVDDSGWSNYTQVAANTTSFQDLAVGELETYSYRVVAYNDAGDSSASNEASSFFPFNAPTTLVAQASDVSVIDLSWSDNSFAETGYRIERKSGAGSFEEQATVDANISVFSDLTVSLDVPYTYRIVGVHSGGESAPTNEATATTSNTLGKPNTPSGLAASALAYDQIQLTWTDNSVYESGFRIERKAGAGGTYGFIGNVLENIMSYTDANVSPDTEYFYRVSSFISGFQSSDLSGEASATTPSLPIPGTPNNLTAILIDATYVMLNWTDNSIDELGFRIERKVDDSGWSNYTQVAANTTSFQDLAVGELETYSYRVVAFNDVGDSSASNEASSFFPFNAPTTLVAQASDVSVIDLSWSDNSFAETGYRIERKSGAGSFEEQATVDAGISVFSDLTVSVDVPYTYRVVGVHSGGESAPTNEATAATSNTLGKPNTPSGLAASALAFDQIQLTWTDNSSNESGFRIERKAGAGGTYGFIGNMFENITSYTDANLSPDTEYFYRVSSFISGFQSSDLSGEASATTPSLPIPGSPNNLTANLIDATYVVLNWTDNSIDELGFRIERKVDDSGWSNYTQVAANTTSFQDLAVGELETYSYRVVAFNDAGDSSETNEASTFFPFNAPTTLTAYASDVAVIDLSWSDKSLAETGYRIERKTGEGSFEELATVDADISVFSDLTVSVDVPYTYRVVGVHSGGESAPTNEATATTSNMPGKPNTPSGLAASALAFDQIQLTWTDNSANESGFRIERKEGAGGTYEFIGNVLANITSFTDENLSPGTEYFYRITSFIGGFQSSDLSGEVSATTPAIPSPDAPAALEISSSNLSVVSLSWSDNSAVESGFKIQRKAGEGDFEELAVVARNVTIFNDSSVSEMQSYTYRIFSYNNGGESDFSNEVDIQIPFGAPQHLIGQAVSPQQIDLSWVDISSIETGYRLERKRGEEDFEVVDFTPADEVNYSDLLLEAATTYTYRVIAIQGQNESLPSNVLNITTPSMPLPAEPTGITVQELSESSVSVSWTDNSSNELGFKIYRREASSGVWLEIAEVVSDVNLFVDENVVAGVDYSYRVSAFNGTGEDNSAESDYRISIAGRLINISTRGLVEKGDNVMIAGFVVQGDAPKTVLIRGRGPSIAHALNAPILEDPQLTLYSPSDPNTPVAFNDDWRDTEEAAIIATGIPPEFDNESALIVKLQPGAHTVILGGVNQGTGFGIVEVFEIDFAKNTRMVNISTRGFIEGGDKQMIGGFIIRGDTPTRVFIRATGPGLPPDIENRLNDPIVSLFSGPDLLVFNDNWQDGDQIGEIIATGIAPTEPNEAAIVATLEPGAYTAIVGGANGNTGYGLLEIYYYPE